MSENSTSNSDKSKISTYIDKLLSDPTIANFIAERKNEWLSIWVRQLAGETEFKRISKSPQRIMLWMKSKRLTISLIDDDSTLSTLVRLRDDSPEIAEVLASFRLGIDGFVASYPVGKDPKRVASKT